jgi:hypothetical protein
MFTAVKFTISVLALAAACFALDGLTIDNKRKERVSSPEAEKIYSSVCSVVQREFGIGPALNPQARLSLGAENNEVQFAGREIRLAKWIATLSHRESIGLPLRI